ncbi:MAG: hypothetical protein INR69_21220, partial [Mucilaginibacter polytrichastri]|nr:hypothetical protein [Mucilaginibacter polytrichastri]
MHWLYKMGLAIAFCWLFSPSLTAQDSLTCADIHQGIFYNYPRNSTVRYMDIYEGNYLHETDLTTGDTSLWKVTWGNDCSFTLSLIDMNGKDEQATRRLMKKHKLAFTVNHLADDYYTF